MKKIKKSMLKSYAVLSVGIALILVSGFFAAKAQTDEPSILDQIMFLFLQSKVESKASVPSQPVVSEPTVGMTQRPDVVITKYLDYDDILTSGVAVTASTTGSFIVDNVLVQTGANTMASGTLFQIYTMNNDYGTSTVLLSTQVSNLPKATAIDLNTLISNDDLNSSTLGAGTGYASSTQRVVLDDGAALWAKCTGASCKESQIETEIDESSKNMRITVILKPTDPWSSIYE